ncbi:NAD(P)H-hydrate epimerase [Ruania alba]|uniref:Bifunctional NAD(P)H-hydrate repair enzyme n=1 Tax=Ruania alba TaxID=648782 RepID=A0A1H5CA45_9MICO|nr:NAD(P)H-hydrate epimerase [Ruania alba]SED63274.1 yjeF N-terminal region [Ruania alba]
MIRGYGAEEVRAAEAPALAAGVPLMLWAARGVAAAVRQVLTERRVSRRSARVLVLVGGGNNGGDGLHAAALLAERGITVTVALARVEVHAEGLAHARARGVRIVDVAEGPDGGPWVAEAERSHVWVDALAGIGVHGGLRGVSAAVVERLDQVRCGQRVIAVDTPSGVGADSGAVAGPVLHADRTVTMGAMKAGLLLPPAAGMAGSVQVLDLGLGAAFAAQAAAVTRLEVCDVARLWPVPGQADHKYSRGVLGVVAGSARYPGAAVLTTGAALRTGCGMVRYLGQEPAVADRVLDHYPEAVTAPGRVQALVVGPGLAGVSDRGRVVAQIEAADQAAVRAGVPLPAVVWDAGALAALPTDPEVNRRRRTVLTPHAGELAELLRARRHPVDRAAIESDPARWVRTAAEVTGATVLLKGAVTLVAAPDASDSRSGGGSRVRPSGTGFDGGNGIPPDDLPLLSQADGPPWLATAGSGDVLAGILGALLATSDAPAPELAAAAALVHGRAAQAANPGGPVTPSDLVAALPATVADLLTAR